VKLKGYEQPSITYATKFNVLNTFLSLEAPSPNPVTKTTAAITTNPTENPILH
jgi:hypothetical protein